MPAMSNDTLNVQLASLYTETGITPAKWLDILRLPQSAQQIVLQDYKDADWVVQPNKLAAVIGALGVIGTILGVVSGGAGAVTAIAALKTL
jgi:hypothetical protein